MRSIFQLPLDLLRKRTALLPPPIGILVYNWNYIGIHILPMCDAEILFTIKLSEVRGLSRCGQEQSFKHKTYRISEVEILQYRDNLIWFIRIIMLH